MSANDNKIKELIAAIAQQKEKLGDKPKSCWKTNGIFKFAGKEVNINVLKSEKDTVTLLCQILMEKEAFEKAAKMLDSKQKLCYNQDSAEDWIDDIKLKHSQIKWKNDNDKLAIMETDLKKLMSNESKTELEIENIADLLNDFLKG